MSCRLTCLLFILLGLSVRADGAETNVRVFEGEELHWIKALPTEVEPDGYKVSFKGQTVERTLSLPARPATGPASRITLRVTVDPVMSPGPDGIRRPNDRWTRMGNVTALVPVPDDPEPRQLELMRFTTGYGSRGVFEQDVSAFAPVLHGPATLRAMIATFSVEPGWRISVDLIYDTVGAAQRRPAYARPLFLDLHVGADRPKLSDNLVVPEGLDVLRLQVISTGHATDGRGANEFVTCTHVLMIDGREIAMWRPWSESGGLHRNANPWSGRHEVDGREVWSSDLDRSGWHPGTAVEPLIIPLPELTPGPHSIQLRIRNIREKDPPDPNDQMKEHHGYWAVSAVLIADDRQ